ncbi:cytochrome family subfamily polypeptide 55 precursor [Stylonychia lemnae]|uniref:Cytochrome family subfamily polypeptide 55 n=1 Tax=Stylonychia lemnae TaxID=5949 RepID=A0A078A2L8_STYLE|nr:cytochrome family subfamily polypeptide 55 precursor [Stylonychia lemnae]|eukprot:CDW76461.1 cytochrome family subfamily polypeptide 55 precursor [Stylonychia lemnae]
MIQLLLLIALAYFLYEKVFKFYYRYWFYRSQGIPALGIPWPILGTLWNVKKVLDNMGPYSKTILEEYWHNYFGDQLPPIFSDHRMPCASIIFCDPTYVNEIYTTKTKYMDKHPKFSRTSYVQFKNSTSLQRSTEDWNQKRKHLTQAFYKDKIKIMLKSTIAVTNARVKEWQQIQQSQNPVIILNKQVQELIDDVIQVCVFGQSNLKKQVTYFENGKEIQLTIGKYLRILTEHVFSRYGGLRQMTDIFDYVPVTPFEFEVFKNAKNFKIFIQTLLDERRVEMSQPNWVSQGDFLTILMQDEYFKSDEVIIDECNTFMLAANLTTSITLTNLIFYLIKDQSIMRKVREESIIDLKVEKGFQNLSDEQWSELLTYEGLNNCNYLNYCILESLRIDPPARVTTPHCFTEDIEICGKKILADSQWHINIQYLHHNPKEWIDPEEFIPERFDPASQYYLTPQGNKRHPMSFGPFLGGKRICLGKTFAESMLKCMFPVIINQIDFEFDDLELFKRKPTNTFLQKEPSYMIKLKNYSGLI